jgi:DNA gyrase/topoisomerase IV subunit A
MEIVRFVGGFGDRLSEGLASRTAFRPYTRFDGVFGAGGKGAVRLMSGFRSNKAPGAGGKAALKTDRLVGAAVVGENDDVFAISRLSKIIRFLAAEVPPKEGVVQGVNCMALRADEAVVFTTTAS